MGACCSAQYSSRKERKRQIMEALAAEAKTNELLSRIPGRMCSNGASSTACIFTQQGRKGTNQDAMVVWENYACRKDTVFCGVFDGHGPYGHLVARRVRDALPSKLMAIWKAHMRGEQQNCNNKDQGESEEKEEEEEEEEDENEENGSSDVQHKDAATDLSSKSDAPVLQTKEPEMFGKWRDSMLKSFQSMDTDLRQHPTIDCFCSGTTAVTVLKQGDDLVVGNVGDSRAILGRRRPASENKLEAIQLTVDLKPSLPGEAERIRRCKGRVFALEDEPEVARVWLPFDDAPGLAMARAFGAVLEKNFFPKTWKTYKLENLEVFGKNLQVFFEHWFGDFCLKDFGLISVPDVTYRRLTALDQFIVLATDGVWDVLSNQEVVEVVDRAPTRATAARALVETAVRAWRLKYPTSKVDDCAVVCLFLQHSQQPPAAAPLLHPLIATEGAAASDAAAAAAHEAAVADAHAVASSYHHQPHHAGSSDQEELTVNGVEVPLPEAAGVASTEGAENQDVVEDDAPDEDIYFARSNTVRTPARDQQLIDPVSSGVAQGQYADDSANGGHDHHHHHRDDDQKLSHINVKEKEPAVDRSHSVRSLADCLSTAPDEEEEWSALDGVVRVNSLLHLPRFLGGDKRESPRTKKK